MTWETLIPKYAQLELVKSLNARMLNLDDQPQEAEEAIATFIKTITPPK